MDWSFWGVLLGVLSLGITIIVCTAGMLRSWDALAAKQKQSDDRVLTLVMNITEFMKELKEYVKSNEKFHTEVRKDIEQFKQNGGEQQELCRAHTAITTNMEHELKLQTVIQQLTKEIFEEVKSVQIRTTDAINALVNVTGKMEMVLKTQLPVKN